MTSEARIHGDEQLAFGLAQAALELERMNTADRAVATLVFTAASGRVPVKTGRLRASGMPQAAQGVATVGYSVPYANPIHWGWPTRGIEARPWLTQAAEAKEPAMILTYQAAVQQVLNGVHGA